MTNQPKAQHGGKREGAGHPKNPYPLQLIKIACTEEEYREILKLSTRERAEKLLKAIERVLIEKFGLKEPSQK